MNYIADKLNNIQAVWKQLALFGSWLVVVAGSFLLPLPDWDSSEQHASNTRFILFITTVISGFTLLLTYEFRNKKFWVFISGITFILFCISYYVYDIKREAYTLPYYGKTKVVGSIALHDFENKIKLCGLEKNDKELLKCVWGNPSQLWTKDSIDSNRSQLKLFLTISYCLIAIFLISFTNLLILTSSKNETT